MGFIYEPNTKTMFYGIMKIEYMDENQYDSVSGRGLKKVPVIKVKSLEITEEKPHQYYSSPCLLPELDEEDWTGIFPDCQQRG